MVTMYFLQLFWISIFIYFFAPSRWGFGVVIMHKIAFYVAQRLFVKLNNTEMSPEQCLHFSNTLLEFLFVFHSRDILISFPFWKAGRSEIVLCRCLLNNLGSSREEFAFVFVFKWLHNLFSNLYFMQNPPQALMLKSQGCEKWERKYFSVGVILYNRCAVESLIRLHLNFK